MVDKGLSSYTVNVLQVRDMYTVVLPLPYVMLLPICLSVHPHEILQYHLAGKITATMIPNTVLSVQYFLLVWLLPVNSGYFYNILTFL